MASKYDVTLAIKSIKLYETSYVWLYLSDLVNIKVNE